MYHTLSLRIRWKQWNSDTDNTKRPKNWLSSKQNKTKRCFILLRLFLLKLCITVANVVWVTDTHSHTHAPLSWPCTVNKLRTDASQREVNITFLFLLLQKKRHFFFVWKLRINTILILSSPSSQMLLAAGPNWNWHIGVKDERFWQRRTWMVFFRLSESSGPIATLHKSFCCYLCYVL